MPFAMFQTPIGPTISSHDDSLLRSNTTNRLQVHTNPSHPFPPSRYSSVKHKTSRTATNRRHPGIPFARPPTQPRTPKLARRQGRPRIAGRIAQHPACASAARPRLHKRALMQDLKRASRYGVEAGGESGEVDDGMDDRGMMERGLEHGCSLWAMKAEGGYEGEQHWQGG